MVNTQTHTDRQLLASYTISSANEYINDRHETSVDVRETQMIYSVHSDEYFTGMLLQVPGRRQRKNLQFSRVIVVCVAL